MPKNNKHHFVPRGLDHNILWSSETVAVYNNLMGTLFPNSAEYPDYEPIPRFTARLGHDGPIVPLAIAATLLGLCPIVLEEHGHPIHEDNRPVNYRVPAFAVSSTSSGGSVTVTPSSGSFGLTGYAPTIGTAPSSTRR